VLLRNHLRPGGEMTSFWARRIRRLMPAATLALIGVVIFGATVATRQQADALPGDVFAAATWTANWHFILSGQSYLNLFAAPSPVQHFWSLAIEEQFYLVLPVVMVFVVRRTRSLRVLLAVLGDEQPDDAVHQDPGAAEEREDDEQYPDDRRVDVEVTTQTSGHTGDVAVGAAAAKTVDVAHLLATHAGTLRGCVGRAGGVALLRAALRISLLVHVIHRVRPRGQAVSGRVLISGAFRLRVFT